VFRESITDYDESAYAIVIGCGILYGMFLTDRISILLWTVLALISDAFQFLQNCLRSKSSLAAENLFLRKQLSLYQERKKKPRRASDSTRLALVFLSKFCDWRNTLTVVKPETLIGWHRKVFRLIWRWKSKPRGRPRLPINLRNLIREMAVENPTWGEERIADELLIKLACESRLAQSGATCPRARARGTESHPSAG